MLLNEILNTSNKITWVYDGKYEAVASFRIKTDKMEKKYFVLFHAHGTSDDSWSVMFGDKNDQTGNLNLTDDTKDFESLSVLSSIKQVLHDFISKYQPREFTFTSDDKRTNLYLRLFNKFLPGTKISREGDVYKVHIKD